MMRNITIFLLFSFFIIANAIALKGNNTLSHAILYPNDSLLNRITNIDQRLKEFTIKDTLGGFSTPRKIETSSYFKSRRIENEPLRDREGLIVVPLEYQPFLSYINFIDTIIVAPEMLPIVFEGKMLPRALDFKTPSNESKYPSTSYLISRDSIISTDLLLYKLNERKNYKLIRKDSTLSNELWRANRTSLIRKQYYINHPERVKLNALAFNDSPIIKKEVESKNPFKELISAGDAIEISRPDIAKHQVKQVYWKKWGEHKLDVSQKSYSKNWNPKTNNSFQIQNYHKFNAKYRKNKIEFNHWVEWRLNVQSISIPNEEKEKNEKYNSLVINDDWVRTYNKLGLDAFIKKWSYIITLDMKTPVFIKRRQNDVTKREAALFSPLELNFGIGAGYTFERKSKTTKDRGFKLAIDAKPLSVDLKHVGSHKVYETNQHGIKYEKGHKKEGENRYTKTELGSTLNTTLDYKFNSYTSVYSRTKYFTNYERTYLEFENTLKFQLNRFLATSLYLYLKYDDSVGVENKDKKYKYFSYNEVLGFGLSYTW